MLTNCMLCLPIYNPRQVEGRPAEGSGMSSLVYETLEHLTPDHMTYFVQWCLMLDLEKQVDQSKKTVADIWCKNSVERWVCESCADWDTVLNAWI